MTPESIMLPRKRKSRCFDQNRNNWDKKYKLEVAHDTYIGAQ